MFFYSSFYFIFHFSLWFSSFPEKNLFFRCPFFSEKTKGHSLLFAAIKLWFWSKSTHNMFFSSRRGDIVGHGNTDIAEWELRPGGMVVQKRNSDVNQNFTSKSTIKVRVKYGSSYHHIQISSHASFGKFIFRKFSLFSCFKV